MSAAAASDRLDAAISECEKASTEVHDVMATYAQWLKDRGSCGVDAADRSLLERLREIAEGENDD